MIYETYEHDEATGQPIGEPQTVMDLRLAIGLIAVMAVFAFVMGVVAGSAW